MGGISLTVTTKEKPEQSLFEPYILLHPEMRVEGQLAQDPSKRSRKPDVVLSKNEEDGTEDESPIQISGPYRVFEDEDMIPEVAKLVPAPCWEIVIWCGLRSEENSKEVDDFARHVADKYKGVVYSPEMGVEWPPTRRLPHASPRVFDVLALEWFVLSSKEAIQSAQPILDVLRVFPEARPVRFGAFMPLQGKLAPEDDKPFLDAWKGFEGTMYFKATKPCLGGNIRFPKDEWAMGEGGKGREARIHNSIIHITLEFEEGVLSPEQLEKAVKLFVDLARRLGCFYARGYIDRGYSLYGGELDYGPGEIKMPPVFVHYGWLGIPPYQVWLNWFGKPYVKLVMDSVKQLMPLIAEEGVFVRLGKKPADMRQLEAGKAKLDLPKELLEGWARIDASKEEKAAREREEAWIPLNFRGMRADLIPKLDD